MEPDDINALAGSWPGTGLSMPFGPGTYVWKVADKMFCAYGDDGVTVKCRDADEADFLIEIGAAERARYLTRGGWVRVRWGDEAMAERLRTSYETVQGKRSKRVRESLGRG